MTYSHTHTPGDSGDSWADGALARDLAHDLDWVQRLAFRLCSDRALSEDLRQEAALAVLGQGAPEEGGRRRWLAGIVRNKLRMKRRTEARREAREAGVARAESMPVGVDVVERAETQRAVTDAVLRLREPYRTTVLHRYFDQWTPSEIAERTETSIDTVKSRLKRGLLALEADLASVFGDATAAPKIGDGAGPGWFSALFPLAVMESKRRAPVSAAFGMQGLASVPLTTAGLLLMLAKCSLLPLGLLGLLLLTRDLEGVDSPAPAAATATNGLVDVPLPHVSAAKTPDDLRRAALDARTKGTVAQGNTAALACELSGHVMNDRGQSLEGATVALYRGDDERLVAATTGADGRFFLSLPPRSERPPETEPEPLLELRIEAEWFHSSERLEFGGLGWRGRLPLIAGPRDVGTVVLGPASAVAGRVFDADGAPIAGATVTTAGDQSATSKADGSFRIERVVPGPDTLEVRVEGIPIVEATLTLDASSVAAGIEIRMQPKKFLRGRVVDGRGQPVAGARVELDPVNRSDISRTKSGADGHFEMPFLWLESAYLRVNADGYDLWDSEESDQEVSPDSAAIHVELRPSASVEVTVIDAKTAQLIECFGIEVRKGVGSEGMQLGGDAAPPLQDRPGGRAAVEGRNEYDQLVVIAEGYELFRNDLMGRGLNADGVRTQTVRLQPRRAAAFGSIRGRIVRGGVPVANAFLEVEGGILMGARLKQLAGRSGDVFVASGSDSDSRLIQTAADGSFALRSLEWPLYRIRVHAQVSAMQELPIVKLADGADVDLGDIEYVAGGTVRGQVILPPGVSPKGLVASAGYGPGSVRAPLDDGGNFELLHVPAGDQTVDITTRSGDLEEGLEVDVFVTAGRATFVQIDGSGTGVARVRLDLDLDGETADGCRVVFVDADRTETVIAMDLCDGSGRIDTQLPANGDVAVCVMANLGQLVRHPKARLKLEPGANLDLSLRFRFGAATVAVEAAHTLPPDGGLAVELFDVAGVLHQRVVLEIEEGEILDSETATYSSMRGAAGGFELTLHRVLEGEWTVKVSVMALDFRKGIDPSHAQPEVRIEAQRIVVPRTSR